VGYLVFAGTKLLLRGFGVHGPIIVLMLVILVVMTASLGTTRREKSSREDDDDDSGPDREFELARRPARRMR